MKNLIFAVVLGLVTGLTTSAQVTNRPNTSNWLRNSRDVPHHLRNAQAQHAVPAPAQKTLRQATTSPEVSWVQCQAEAQGFGAMCGTLPVPLDCRHPGEKKIN